jgi:hypothetical protein
MNKRRQGIVRLTTLANENDPANCPALSAQWTFMLDNASVNAFVTADDTTQNNGVANHIGDGQCRRP